MPVPDLASGADRLLRLWALNGVNRLGSALEMDAKSNDTQVNKDDTAMNAGPTKLDFGAATESAAAARGGETRPSSQRPVEMPVAGTFAAGRSSLTSGRFRPDSDYTIALMCRAAIPGPSRTAAGERPNVRELFLLTRPYSWIDMMLNVLIGLSWTESVYNPARHASAAIVGLLLWFSLNWISEAVQRDVGRRPPRWSVAILPLLAGTAWSLWLGGSRSVVWLALFAALVGLYPWKARSPVLGPLGPVIRGLQTGTLFLLGTTFGGGGRFAMGMALSLVLIQTARSLVADIRDAKTDRYELPGRIGHQASKWTAVALLIGGIACLANANPAQPDAIAILAIALLPLIFLRTEYSYEIHLWLVATFMLTKLVVYTEFLESMPGFLLVSIPVQLLLIVTYWYVPRPSNAVFRDHLDRAIRITTGRQQS